MNFIIYVCLFGLCFGFIIIFWGVFFCLYVCLVGWLIVFIFFLSDLWCQIYAQYVNNIYPETIKVQDKCSDKIIEETRLQNDNWYCMNSIWLCFECQRLSLKEKRSLISMPNKCRDRLKVLNLKKKKKNWKCSRPIFKYHRQSRVSFVQKYGSVNSKGKRATRLTLNFCSKGCWPQLMAKV
jgi:hypothetical protein